MNPGNGATATGPSTRGPFRVTPAHGTDPDHGGAAVVEVLGRGEVTVDGTRTLASLEALDADRARLSLTASDGTIESHQVLTTATSDPGRVASGVHRVEIVIDGWRFELDVDSEARARLRERATSARSDPARGGPRELRAIIPGRVVSVEVAEGDAVELGGRLLVLEAMKMQNELKAPRAGTVSRVAVGAGQTVELGDLLMVIE